MVGTARCVEREESERRRGVKGEERKKGNGEGGREYFTKVEEL
jgi:hypothetical protein